MYNIWVLFRTYAASFSSNPGLQIFATNIIFSVPFLHIYIQGQIKKLEKGYVKSIFSANNAEIIYTYKGSCY